MTGEAIGAVAIGASAGAVQTLLKVLPALPADYPLPIFIVVHVPPDRDNALVSLFGSKCAMPVKEAEDKESAAPGMIYFAPSDYHLLVEADHSLALAMDEPVNHSRPSIDVLLESAADTYRGALLGIVMTGANHDGAAGLRAVATAGGQAIVENPETAETGIMPAAALEACPHARVLDIGGIKSLLLSLAELR